MSTPLVIVRLEDPQGPDALHLLRLAAIEARALYPELHGPGDLWPTNEPTPPRGAYFVAYVQGRPVGMGAHRPLEPEVAEVRRMYVDREFRRNGVAKVLLGAIEIHAHERGFVVLRLETGNRQLPAMHLYESSGFKRIPPFGEYQDHLTSVCYEKSIHRPGASEA